MKNKLLIGFGIALLLLVIGLMIKDAVQKPGIDSNPYEYNLDNFTDIGIAELCYSLTKKVEVPIETLRGIAGDKRDRIYVCGKNNVMIFDPSLEKIGAFEINGEARNIHITDTDLILLGMYDHIEIVDLKGKFAASWEIYNDRSVITSIASDENYIYVADAGNKIVLQYDYNGVLMQEVGKKDSQIDRPGFIIPSAYFDLAIGREGQLWVVNSGLHSFESYSAEGKLISSWKQTSMALDGFSGCCNPTHFAMLSDGSYVTSEKGLVRVKIHEPNGNYRCVVARPNDFNEEEVGIDLAVNSTDDIFLIVPGNKEIRKYSTTSE